MIDLFAYDIVCISC